MISAHTRFILMLSAILAVTPVLGGGKQNSPFKPFKPPQNGTPKANSYVGASMGASTAEDMCSGSGCENTDTAWKLFGGYRLGQSVVLEGGYTNLGTFSSSEESAEVSGFMGSLLMHMPINEQFDIFGRAGMFKWDSEINDGASTQSFDDMDPFFGIGADYQYSPNLAIRGEWETYQKVVATSDGGLSDASALSLGVTFSSL